MLSYVPLSINAPRFPGAVVTSAMIVAVGVLPECTHLLGSLSVYVIGLSFCGVQYGGALVAHLDLASHQAAVIAGIVTAAGASAHFVVPSLRDLLLDGHQSNTSPQVDDYMRLILLIIVGVRIKLLSRKR